MSKYMEHIYKFHSMNMNIVVSDDMWIDIVKRALSKFITEKRKMGQFINDMSNEGATGGDI